MTKCIFLPGWYSTEKLSKYFYLSFFQNLTCFDEIECLFFPDRGVKHSIPDLSTMAANYLYTHAEEDVHVIGYSMGGVIGKYMVDRYPYIAKKTQSLTMIASPLHGTSGWHKFPAYFSRSATDMLKDSLFMQEFTNRPPNNIKKLTIAAQYDGLITQSSAFLKDAQKVVVEGATHLTVLQSHKTQDSIKKFVRTESESVPSLRFLQLHQ